MPYLIDGHNLIGTWPGLRVGDREAEAGLRQALARFLRSRRTRGIAVFDGHPPDDLQGAEVTLGPLKVVYAGPGRGAADRKILALLEAVSHTREWTVVTSDRALGQASRTRGGQWIRSASFRRQMEEILSRPGDGEEPSPGPVEVADWMDWFRRKRDGPG